MSIKLEDSINIDLRDHQVQDIQGPDGDFDILDEFLDRRLYDQENQSIQQNQNQQQQQQSQALQPNQFNDHKDEELFSSFLTEDISKNDFLYFNNGSNPNQTDFDITNFEVPQNNINAENLQLNNHLNTDNTNNNSNNYSHNINAATPNSLDLQSPDTSKNEVFTTPNSINIDPSSSHHHSHNHNQHQHSIVSPNPNYDPSYETSREVLSQLKFGKDTPTQFDNALPQHYLDIDANSLPYQMNIKNLPSYSRVETQIKIDLSISPPPPQFLVHLPSDTIAKQKLCLKDDQLKGSIRDSMLFLDTFVLTGTTLKSCNICARCVKREQKRASRRKSGVSDNLNWGTNTSKRAIIFNCKEVISFPPSSIKTAAVTANVPDTKDLEISARLVCYCRHHQESKGFKLLFVLKDSNDQVLAKHISTPIMIMDRKKTLDDNGNSATESIQTSNNNGNGNGSTSTTNNSNNNSDVNLNLRMTQPLSPTSIEEDSSEPHTTDSRVFKRKRTWSPELSDGFSIAPSRKPSYLGGNLSSSNIKREPISPSSAVDHSNTSASAINSTLPSIQRVIPSQGPLRGGVEVTLLGSNFRQGLTVKFGINKALSTHCWSDSTIVTYLPPASTPGQVIVTFEENEDQAENINSAIFTYLDDSDRQLIELALQIVGLKMNGKLEDARNIARKIIGSDEGQNGNNNGNGNGNNTNGDSTSPNGVNMNSLNALSSYSDEELVSKVINLLPSNPNWSLCTQEGQTLLHLSCLKGYTKLVSLLLRKGARVDSRDVNGFTPLHFASIAGDRNSIELLINCKANLTARSNNGSTPEDIADSNVLDLFKYHSSMMMQRKFSNSSISSSIFSIENENLDFHSGGAHVSRLVTDHLTDNSLESDEYDSESIEAGDEESDDAFTQSGEDADYEDEDDEAYDVDDSFTNVGASATRSVPNSTDSEQTLVQHNSDASLWNKVKNVFQNNGSSNVEDLPKYDDLFPSGSKSNFTIPKLRFSTTTTGESSSSTNNNGATSSSDENEDAFVKFFHQRKNVQNDKMLIFFWLPLLILIGSFFILINSGWTFDWNDQFQEFVRIGLGKIMLGNERVKIAFNRHFNQVNEAVTSVINVNN